jgi:hypothetical protein
LYHTIAMFLLDLWQCFSFLYSIINGIVVLILIFTCSLLEYRNKINFLCLLNSFNNSRNCLFRGLFCSAFWIFQFSWKSLHKNCAICKWRQLYFNFSNLYGFFHLIAMTRSFSSLSFLWLVYCSNMHIHLISVCILSLLYHFICKVRNLELNTIYSSPNHCANVWQ